MKLTKKIKSEVLETYDAWLHSYLNGDVKTYDSFFNDDFHFIGSTNNEEFLNRKATTTFFEATAEQLAGKTELRNETKIVEQFGDIIFITHLFDAWFLAGKDWTFYGRFRFSNALQKGEDGWRFIYQHYSVPDSKAQNGETIGFDQITKENLQLREAIQRRTVELESKNRELEIESALERVRAIAMSMRTSEELIGVCKVVFKELQKLGFTELRNTMIHIFKDEKQYFINYDYSDATGGNTNQIPYKGNPGMEKFIKAIRKSEHAFHHLVVEGKELKDWKKFRKENKEYKDPSLDKTKSLHYYNYSVGSSGIGISTYSAMSNEKKELLQRFRNVFQLAYKRFTDISLAEMQAREAQIDLALVRIRSQATAMKESSDLLDIVVTMRTEFTRLGHKAHYFWHMMWLPEKYEKAMTSSDGTKIGFVMELPRHIHGDIPLLAKWEKSKKPIVVYAMDADEAIAYVDKMSALGDFQNIDPQAPSHDDIRHIDGLTFIMARTTHGEIGYSLPGVVENPPNEDLEILERFAGAFDLAHRRFLDLQKAERQARETQIELSLERIRSRATAMKESSDLFDIVVSMRNEFISLGHEADYFWNMRWLPDSYEMSMTAEDGCRLGMVISVPKFVHEKIESLNRWEQSDSPYFVLALTGKEAWDYIDNMNTYGKYQQIDPHAPTEKDILHLGGLTFIIARTTHGEIGFSLAGKVDDPPKEAIDTLVRFATVFDLAYKRFEDLKNAEAQTLETQIELALEKVRSRSMGMHKSDELADLSLELVKQVQALGISTWFCAFNIYDDEYGSLEWGSNGEGVFPKYKTPREGIFLKYYKAGQTGQKLLVNEIGEVECPTHYEYLCTLPGVGNQLLKMKEEGIPFPTHQIDHVAFFKYGYIIFITYDSVPEFHEIFKRFAKVFEQTYTRFLDLQKAEAQAKEAQIEAALEKVRSRSLAMHNSEELQEVITTVLQQLNGLDLAIDSAIVILPAENGKDHTAWIASFDFEYSTGFNIPFGLNSFVSNDIDKALYNGNASYSKLYSNEDKNVFYNELFENSDFKSIPQERKDFLLNIDIYGMSMAVCENSGIITLSYLGKILNQEEIATLHRFALVFEQAYTRFLDLQKAEAQAREVQIEAALERVRSKSMAMHSSTELKEVITIIMEQFKELDFELDLANFNYLDKTKDWNLWMANPEMAYPEKIHLPYIKNPLFDGPIGAYKNNVDFFSDVLTKEQKDEFVQHVYANTILNKYDSEERKEYILGGKGFARSVVFTKHILLTISNFNAIPYSDEQNTILKRFAKVFEQTYTRFLDLQKAEAQAREAQIEAALERVRSRSMAMHNSEELLDVITVVSEQLLQLNFRFAHVSFANNDLNQDYKFWVSAIGMPNPMRLTVPYLDIPLINNLREVQQSGSTFFTDVLTKQENSQWHKHLIKHGGDKVFSKEVNEYSMSRGMARSIALHPNIILIIANYAPVPYSEDENKIIVRFGQVFEQSYTRFLDLQKAEAQAREAQIETALERVRSRSIGMQKSQDLSKVVLILDEELIGLGIEVNGTQILTDFDNPENNVTVWFGMKGQDHLEKFHVPEFNHPIRKKFQIAWKKGIDFYTEQYSKTEKNKFFRQLFKYSDFGRTTEERKNFIYDSPGLTRASVLFKNSILIFQRYRLSEFTTEEITIFKRFGKVFEQAYTRFLDLKKAEKQAKEAQIEASLERVRSRTMAMHQSDELREAGGVLYQELTKLDITSLTIGYVLMDASEKIGWNYTANPADGTIWEVAVGIPHDETDIMRSVTNSWEKQQPFSMIQMDAEQTIAHQTFIAERGINFPYSTEELISLSPEKITLYNFNFKQGYLLIVGDKKLQPEQEQMLMRFTNVFQQTYTRFLDLQKAEAQTREAQIEASLERVRAKAMSMQDSNELDEVLSVLCEQFDTLGIVPMSTHMTVLDLKNNTFTFRETGKYGNRSFGEQTVALDAMDNWKETVDKWKADKATAINKLHFPKQQLPEVWNVFHESFASMPEDSRITPEDYPDGIYHTAGKHPFGYIGMNQIRSATQEEEQIVIKFANEFGRAYQRFLDLQKAEAQAVQAERDLIEIKAARKKAEDALTELQETQKQLIQSEKMASLGELTAGIAHEIQNPLNFVNNFSEVSTELIDEIEEELANGDMEEVKAILIDIKQNLEKINHHGKRADDIVKGMLQHSRSSSGTKEPTDINALCDEYLRLAYHGLRAKDKSFNATLETDFGKSLEKINVIPQDIGRVVLNLITNAFYVVSEAKAKEIADSVYEPTVTVSTKKEGDKILISVKDNGNGIPDNIKEKIFQPFFTTKPTGQGTGLGLSMSYDIVKAHGGELKVKTRDGEGSTFMIDLPIN